MSFKYYLTYTGSRARDGYYIYRCQRVVRNANTMQHTVGKRRMPLRLPMHHLPWAPVQGAAWSMEAGRTPVQGIPQLGARDGRQAADIARVAGAHTHAAQHNDRPPLVAAQAQCPPPSTPPTAHASILGATQAK